ncbi:MAG: hypothetical protein K2N92_00175 [Malacoplasma sp.]|nr:hypothetical protein [Malacoplasma sp.]
MKKSLFKKLFLSSSVLAACSICLLTNLNNHNLTSVTQITRNDNVSTNVSTDFNSDQKWIDDIKEAATSAKDSGNIQIFFTRNASLLYQQSLISLLYLFDNTSTSFSENTTSENQTNTGGGIANQKIKQIAYFVDDAVYQTENRFDFSVIKNNENTLFVSKTSDIPTASDETTNSDTQTSTEDSPYTTVPNSEQIDLTYNYYKSALESGKKIDIWAADLTVNSLFSGSDARKGFVKLLPYINKIYILSDGNAQTANFIDAYVKRRKEHYIDDQEAEKIWNQLQDKTKPENERLEILENSSLYDFLRLEKYMNIFHILEYTQSPYWNIPSDRIYRAYAFNIDYYKMSNNLYEENQTTEKQKYLTNYEKFFLLSETTLEKFIVEGFNNYDPKKKNLVWMGDNLWTENNDYTKISANSNMIKEVQNFFLTLTKKYPANEYNYFFKHHPAFSLEVQKEFTSLITGLTDVQPITFGGFGWELFLAWDGYHQINSTNNYVPFFSSNSNKNENQSQNFVPQTQLVGTLYTSSTILTTYSYIRTTYDLNDSEAYLSVDQANFPIVGTYGIWGKGIKSNGSYSSMVSKNKEFIDKIYLPYVEMNNKVDGVEILKDYYNTQEDTKKLFITNGLESPGVTFNDETQNDTWMLIVFPIFAVVFIALIAAITYSVIKNKKNKI